ncbi:bacterioferritin [Brachymonas sp. G13]|uniref:bacterioferritin n=1 Tax=Brachymonas TaxID=28219 RepID=UPI0003813D2F|nr:bacterioferritin [Brachymonas chironomi]
MKGHPEVIAYLNTLVAGELAARDQYFIHSRMYHEWGYDKLYERINHEMDDETQHASALIQRILMLEGMPDMVPEALVLGNDVPSMLQADLEVELRVRDALKKGVALCEQHQDYVSREMLVEQLKDTEEDHAHWLEQQLRLIDQVGLKNYLQSQAS